MYAEYLCHSTKMSFPRRRESELYKLTKQYYVYILASRTRGTLYIGITNSLLQRIHQHKGQSEQGFTQKYNVYRLVYYESGEDVYAAITREKQLKKWNRQWKINLIEKSNPGWRDLYYDLLS